MSIATPAALCYAVLIFGIVAVTLVWGTAMFFILRAFWRRQHRRQRHAEGANDGAAAGGHAGRCCLRHACAHRGPCAQQPVRVQARDMSTPLMPPPRPCSACACCRQRALPQRGAAPAAGADRGP